MRSNFFIYYTVNPENIVPFSPTSKPGCWKTLVIHTTHQNLNISMALSMQVLCIICVCVQWLNVKFPFLYNLQRLNFPLIYSIFRKRRVECFLMNISKTKLRKRPSIPIIEEAKEKLRQIFESYTQKQVDLTEELCFKKRGKWQCLQIEYAASTKSGSFGLVILLIIIIILLPINIEVSISIVMMNFLVISAGLDNIVIR